MPLYIISSKTGLSHAQKQALSSTIVDTHCGLTHAPRSFVNVVFSEKFPLRKRYDLDILGMVRKGRSDQVNKTLEALLRNNICNTINLTEQRLNTTLLEVPASWVMEGGNLIPEPGEEADCDWLTPQLPV